MKYWRTLICASALGVCGLAVWADDCVRGDGLLRRYKTEKSETVTVAAAEPAPAAEADPPVKVIMDVGTPSLPVAPPVVPPPVIPPISDPHVEKAAAHKSEPASPPQIGLPEEPPPLPAKNLQLPPAPTTPSPPKSGLALDPPKTSSPPPLSPSLDLPLPKEKSVPATNPLAEVPMTTPPEPSKAGFVAPPMPTTTGLPPAPAVSVPQSSEPPIAGAASNPPATGPFKMFLRMGGSAQPRFEVKDGDALILKVYFDHVDLKNTHEGLTATGHIRLHGSGLDGTCDQLSLYSTKGEVEMKGNVKLNCYRGGASSLLMAEQVKFQLKGATEPVKPHNGKVVPATWSGSR